MEESGCSGPLFNLFCHEDRTSLEGGEEEEERRSEDVKLTKGSAISVVEDEEEYIRTLVSRETSFERINGGFLSSGDASSAAVTAAEWLKCSRSAAVRWILKTREYFGFSPQTAYLSIAYLDRFFVKRTIDRRQSWAIQLLSVACLSLAAKMEECRVPALTEYPGDECEFEGKAIQRMELLVLSTLGWRMGSLTPFLYLDYFASKFALRRRGKGLLSRATELILAATEGMDLVDHRPSTVAAAAIYAAAGQPLTKTLLKDMIGAVSLCRSLETDRTLSCYNLMTTMIAESGKSQENLPLPFEPASTSCPSSPPCSGDATEGFSMVVACNKRRRLTLSSYDGNCPTTGRGNPV